ncbi:heme-dependent peroxidase [Bifidobacterium sp. ESL0784]|uniref:hydrogen peroxide-dependent heme synthase n=1 Tax=Bifidobacterium sp. ESL0784 TaxID=2983231 RepID=UPI0023F8A298|nr:hydrogen peroxide-dependent heme synthase [Bifidobacterium sp. ESL0784]MDF7641701.1 heme-dependent peroxidase [Bifidobacterium sp. ESL0784]
MQEPVATLDGWYCLDLWWKMDWPSFQKQSPEAQRSEVAQFKQMLGEFGANEKAGKGSWYLFDVSGTKGDLGLILYRETLDELNEIENRLAKLPLSEFLTRAGSFVSIGESGTYSGKPKSERGWGYVERAVKPKLPKKPYVCFYPMSKTRDPGANWYTLPFEQRQAYMKDHGMIGRSFGGRVLPFITGAMGLDDHEWGVLLLADDPLVFKKIIEAMRYAEASAVYGDFPYFVSGTYLPVEDLDHFFLDGWEVSKPKPGARHTLEGEIIPAGSNEPVAVQPAIPPHPTASEHSAAVAPNSETHHHE